MFLRRTFHMDHENMPGCSLPSVATCMATPSSRDDVIIYKPFLHHECMPLSLPWRGRSGKPLTERPSSSYYTVCCSVCFGSSCFRSGVVFTSWSTNHMIHYYHPTTIAKLRPTTPLRFCARSCPYKLSRLRASCSSECLKKTGVSATRLFLAWRRQFYPCPFDMYRLLL